jgi:hypothetical protein
MSIEDLTGSTSPVSVPAEDRETAGYALIVRTLADESHDAPSDAGGGLGEAVKDVFALYDVDAEGWQNPKPQAA